MRELGFPTPAATPRPAGSTTFTFRAANPSPNPPRTATTMTTPQSPHRSPDSRLRDAPYAHLHASQPLRVELPSLATSVGAFRSTRKSPTAKIGKIPSKDLEGMVDNSDADSNASTAGSVKSGVGRHDVAAFSHNDSNTSDTRSPCHHTPTTQAVYQSSASDTCSPHTGLTSEGVGVQYSTRGASVHSPSTGLSTGGGSHSPTSNVLVSIGGSGGNGEIMLTRGASTAPSSPHATSSNPMLLMAGVGAVATREMLISVSSPTTGGSHI